MARMCSGRSTNAELLSMSFSRLRHFLMFDGQDNCTFQLLTLHVNFVLCLYDQQRGGCQPCCCATKHANTVSQSSSVVVFNAMRMVDLAHPQEVPLPNAALNRLPQALPSMWSVKQLSPTPSPDQRNLTLASPSKILR